jgi:CBS domain-containing protein
LEKKKNLTFCKPSTTFPEVMELLDKNPDSSLPVIVIKGKRKKLVGMVSAWDVLEKLVMNLVASDPSSGNKHPCDAADDAHSGQAADQADQPGAS